MNCEPSCSTNGFDSSTTVCTKKPKYSEEIIPAPPPPPILDINVPNAKSDECNVVEHVSIETNNCLSKNDSGDGNMEYDCDFLSSEDEEAIDSLLERPYEDGQTGKKLIPEEGEKREKVVLAHRDMDYFDVLPEGWVEVTHSSGLPIYLHKSSRVCTFSRPYFIGPGSVRHHSVPESAIPCLHQRRVLKEVEERAKESEAALEEALKTSAKNSEGGDSEELAKLAFARLQAPGTKVQSAEDFKQRQLDPQALHDYAKKVFRFKTIQIYRFNKWSATRSFHRQKKMAEAERLGKLSPAIEVPTERPTLPLHVQLITVPALGNNQKPHHKSFFLNPHGKTSVSILHEYVQKVLQSIISYEFEETRNSSTPYACCARLKINLNNRVMNAATIKEKLLLLQEKEKRDQKMQSNGEDADEFVVLGRGCGNSKKAAKLDAAKSALKVLIPAIEFDSEGIARTQKKENEDGKCEEEDAVALFDMLPIEDSRIPDLSARAGQPSPYLILQECLKRHAVHGDTEIKLRSERVKHQKHKFDMDVGKHKVSVICSNKREGKQMASQAMLKKLHPQFDNWGSLIRLYGQETQQKHQEARRCRQSIIKLQGSRDKDNSSFEPNKAILEKLRVEMLNVLKNKQQKNNITMRPPLSYSGEPLNADDVAKDSEYYAKNHQDTQSTFKIDF
uniref:DRBM domain-containing protein n=1 Tax=Syphacia muris TaxID=451379 RepID=A0A0N5AVM4_9BILA